MATCRFLSAFGLSLLFALLAANTSPSCSEPVPVEQPDHMGNECGIEFEFTSCGVSGPEGFFECVMQEDGTLRHEERFCDEGTFCMDGNGCVECFSDADCSNGTFCNIKNMCESPSPVCPEGSYFNPVSGDCDPIPELTLRWEQPYTTWFMPGSDQYVAHATVYSNSF
ncbi:hypothetical protein HN481_03970, partial [Candidatus Parcubacteria bacterium]|nr:hypothetical protein [Candidatus Parcubacteria bacterium]